MKTSTLIIIFIVLYSLMSYNVNAGMIYKCQSPQGDLVYQKTPCDEQLNTVSSWTEAPPQAKKTLTLFVKQGHYFVSAKINEIPVNFMIDTGASYIAISKEIAQRANLKCEAPIIMRTANGKVRACSTTIEKFIFGDFVIEKVTAVIHQNLEEPFLLGMSVLRRFNITQSNGELIISE